MALLEQKMTLVREKSLEVFEMNLKLHEKIEQAENEFERNQRFKARISELES